MEVSRDEAKLAGGGSGAAAAVDLDKKETLHDFFKARSPHLKSVSPGEIDPAKGYVYKLFGVTYSYLGSAERPTMLIFEDEDGVECEFSVQGAIITNQDGEIDELGIDKEVRDRIVKFEQILEKKEFEKQDFEFFIDKMSDKGVDLNYKMQKKVLESISIKSSSEAQEIIADLMFNDDLNAMQIVSFLESDVVLRGVAEDISYFAGIDDVISKSFSRLGMLRMGVDIDRVSSLNLKDEEFCGNLYFALKNLQKKSIQTANNFFDIISPIDEEKCPLWKVRMLAANVSLAKINHIMSNEEEVHKLEKWHNLSLGALLLSKIFNQTLLHEELRVDNLIDEVINFDNPFQYHSFAIGLRPANAKKIVTGDQYEMLQKKVGEFFSERKDGISYIKLNDQYDGLESPHAYPLVLTSARNR